MSVAENDVQAQRLGIVELSFQVERVNSRTLQLKGKLFKLRNCLPLKTAAMHVCTNEPAMRLAVRVLSPVVNLHSLVRITAHCGNLLETHYELLSYGIPVAALPIDVDGNCSNDNHKRWIQKRKEIEDVRKRSAIQSSSSSPPPQQQQQQQTASTRRFPDESTTISTPYILSVAASTLPTSSTRSSSTSSLPGVEHSNSFRAKGSEVIIAEPGPNDCILGRGQPVDQHEGNVQFRKFLQEHLNAYANAPHYMKHKVGNDIQMMLINEHNVRFLKKHESGTGWKVADDSAIREKILRTFRRMMLNDKRQKQQQQQQPQQQTP